MGWLTGIVRASKAHVLDADQFDPKLPQAHTANEVVLEVFVGDQSDHTGITDQIPRSARTARLHRAAARDAGSRASRRWRHRARWSPGPGRRCASSALPGCRSARLEAFQQSPQLVGPGRALGERGRLDPQRCRGLFGRRAGKDARPSRSPCRCLVHGSHRAQPLLGARQSAATGRCRSGISRPCQQRKLALTHRLGCEQQCLADRYSLLRSTRKSGSGAKMLNDAGRHEKLLM